MFVSRGILARAGGGVVLTALAGALVLGSAGTASANQFVGQTLTPGQQVCVQQFATSKVRADGHATGQGAKFKIQFQGVTVPGTGSPGLAIAWAAQLGPGYGPFQGPGYYVACATNNGTANTNVQLQLRTDTEV